MHDEDRGEAVNGCFVVTAIAALMAVIWFSIGLATGWWVWG